jgi:hypothetical protein
LILLFINCDVVNGNHAFKGFDAWRLLPATQQLHGSSLDWSCLGTEAPSSSTAPWYASNCLWDSGLHFVGDEAGQHVACLGSDEVAAGLELL